MAEMLQSQGMQPMQEQPVGQGQFAVRTSPFQMAAKLAQVAAGTHQQSKADESQRELAAKAQSDLAGILGTAQKAAAGSPATPMMEDASSNVTPAQPAVPGNAGEAASIYMRHPMTAPLGMQMMQSDIASKQRQQAMADIMKPDGPSPSYGQPGFAPTGQPQQGNPLSGIPPKIVALMTSGDPELVKLGSTLAENYKMQNVRPGGTVFQPGVGPVFTAPQNGMQTTWGQGGPQSAVVPGAQEAAARGTGLNAFATASAKFPFQEVETGSGRKLPAGMIPGAVNQMPQSWPPAQAPQQPQGAPQAQPSPQATPMANPQAMPQAAPQGQPMGTPQTAPQRPQVVPMAPRALPVTDPWKTMPRLEEPGGVGQSTYQRGRQQQAAEIGAKLAEEHMRLADTANVRKSFNDQSLALLNKATTGPGALGITELQNFLTSRVGIPESLLKAASNGDPTATIELNKNLLNAATQSAKASYGSRMTQSEVMLQIKQASPNVDMTKGAIQYLLKADNARADYQIRQANDLGKYLQQGGDPYRFGSWYGREFPMSNATVHSQAPAPSVPMFATNGKTRIQSTDGGKTWTPAQ